MEVALSSAEAAESAAVPSSSKAVQAACWTDAAAAELADLDDDADLGAAAAAAAEADDDDDDGVFDGTALLETTFIDCIDGSTAAAAADAEDAADDTTPILD
jgi:hypothetical protein